MANDYAKDVLHRMKRDFDKQISAMRQAGASPDTLRQAWENFLEEARPIAAPLVLIDRRKQVSQAVEDALDSQMESIRLRIAQERRRLEEYHRA